MEQLESPRRVLLVDDDSLILRIYSECLSAYGLQIKTADSGLNAIKALRAEKPDLVVLDLMMPKFTGADVVKFLRSQPDLVAVPVIVLSNSYMDDVAVEAASLGVTKALLKIRCTPSILFALIKDITSGKADQLETSQLLAVPKREPTSAAPRTPSPDPAATVPPPGSAPPPKPDLRLLASAVPPVLHAPTASPPASANVPSAPSVVEPKTGPSDFPAEARSQFLAQAADTCATMRDLAKGFARATNPAERSRCLENLCRKVHFVTATAGLAECHLVAQMASAFEVMLYELLEKPTFIGPSVFRTVPYTVDFLAKLFEHSADDAPSSPVLALALVVDDDPVSNHVIGAGLRRAQVNVISSEDPVAALKLLEAKRFDLVLLDIDMPGMSGFELCKHLRALPGYAKTPVIFVSSHTDFASRAKSVLSGGDDLISKPVFPIEVAVKAVTHLLARQLKPRKSATK